MVLKDVFKEVLASVPRDKRLVLFLDSLDQLSSSNNAHSLHWLPLQLPENVKLIVSTLAAEHGILDTIRRLYDAPTHYAEVPSIEAATSQQIIGVWLARASRRLSAQQQVLVDAALQSTVRPLYVKLLADDLLAL